MRKPGLRLQDCEEAALRFLAAFEMPIANDLADRDLHMMERRKKISACIRPERRAGLHDAARHASDCPHAWAGRDRGLAHTPGQAVRQPKALEF